jgi:hypothetical protein
MTTETTTAVEEQTPAQKEETAHTPAPKEEIAEETISKAEVTRMLKRQAAELTAKYKPFEEKARKLEEIEAAKLNENEKASKRLKELEDKIAEKENALKSKMLKDLVREKIEKAIADGKMQLPKGKTVGSLVGLSKATMEEEIDSDLEDLMGFFPTAETTEHKNQAQGAGNPGVPLGRKTWTKAEIERLTPEEHEKHRLDIMAAMQEGRLK